MSPSECCELRLTIHALWHDMIGKPFGWLWVTRWWWRWYAVVSMTFCARCCVVAETNTASTQSIAVTTRSTSLQLIIVFNNSFFVFFFFLKDCTIGTVWLDVDFFCRTNALLRTYRALITVALSNHILFTRSELKKILLIVFGLCVVDDCRLFFFLLRAVYEKHSAENLAEIGSEICLQLIGNAGNANKQSMKKVFGWPDEREKSCWNSWI